MPRKSYRIVSRGYAVQDARIQANLSSKELAALVGLSRPMLSSIENGASTREKTAHRIAESLGKTFEELFEITRPAPAD